MTPLEELQAREALEAAIASGNELAELNAREELDVPSREDYGPARLTPSGRYDIGGGTPISELYPSTAAVTENTASMLTGAAAQPVAGIAGLAQAMNPFAEEGSGGQVVRDVQEALTYQPRSERAQQNQAALADVPGISHAMEAIETGRLGDEALEAGLPPALAAAYESVPELLLAPFALKSLIPKKATLPTLKQSPKTGDLSPTSNRSIQRPRGDKLSPKIEKRFDQAGKLITDKAAKKAVSSGWAEKTVRWVNSQPQKTRTKLREMVDTADDYFHNMEADKLPSDVIGESAAQRVQFVDAVRGRAGRVMNAVAEGQLTKTRVDIAKLRTDLNIALRKLGAKTTPEGVTFGPKSKLWKSGTDQQALIDLKTKLDALGRMPSGKEVHDLKQWIDTYIKSNRSQTAPTGGAITEASQRVLESTRKLANESLRKVSDPYKKANDLYRETKTALDTLQKGAGNIDMSSPEAIGQSLRRVLSNAQARNNMRKGIDSVSKLADKHSRGDLPYENYTPEMRFLSEMEKLWGSFKEESLKGNLGQSAQNLAQSPSTVQGAREIAGLTAKQIRKAATSRDRQLEMMKQILYQGGQ